MKAILTILVPALILALLFKYAGIWGGIIGFAVYLLFILIIKMPDYLMISASKLYRQNPERAKEALNRMEKALRTKRLRAEYVQYYGFMALKAGDIARAERVLTQGEKMKMSEETRCRAAVNRALLAWQKGQKEEAIHILEEQLKLGEDKAVYGTLGQFLLQNGQLQHALELNKKAYAFDKYDEAITDNLALTYRLTGDIDSSANLYKELTGKRLGVPIPYYHYGETLYVMGKKEEAIEYMEKALTYTFSHLAVVSREEIQRRIEEIKAEIAETEKN